MFQPDSRLPEGLKSVTVDGVNYEIGRMPTSKAITLLTRLIKISGAPLARAFKTDGGGETSPVASLADAHLEKFIGPMIEGISERLDENMVLSLLKELISYVGAQGGQQIQFELHFQGRIFHLLKVAAEVLKYNYADFTAGLSDLGVSRSRKGQGTTQELVQ